MKRQNEIVKYLGVEMEINHEMGVNARVTRREVFVSAIYMHSF